jgi:hypothetical protein
MSMTDAVNECPTPLLLSSFASLISLLIFVSTVQESGRAWKEIAAFIGFAGFLVLTLLVVWTCDT